MDNRRSNVGENMNTNMKRKRAITNIKVIGVGGAGGNVIEAMKSRGIRNVDLIAANTDMQQLEEQTVDTLLLGEDITGGMGAGADIEVGREAAEASADEIRKRLEGANLVFVVSGMGGGTGTGAAAVVADVCKTQLPDCLVIGVITFPFKFEGSRKLEAANEGYKELIKTSDGVLVIDNERLLDTIGAAPADESFAAVDETMANFVGSISDLITTKGKINVDFADIKTTLKDSGLILFGIQCEQIIDEDEDIEMLVKKTIENPLLMSSATDAKNIICNITCGRGVSIIVSQKIVDMVRKITNRSHYGNDNLNLIFGFHTLETLEDNEVILTVIAARFKDGKELDVGNGGITIQARIGNELDDEDYSEDLSKSEALTETFDETVEPSYKKQPYTEEDIFGKSHKSRTQSHSSTYSRPSSRAKRGGLFRKKSRKIGDSGSYLRKKR